MTKKKDILNENEEVANVVVFKKTKPSRQKKAPPITEAFLKNSIEKKKIYFKEVEAIQRDAKYGEVLVVFFDNYRCFIPLKEADCQIKWKSLVNFIGRVISVTLTHYDEKNQLLIGSRAMAQNLNKETMAKNKDGVLTGTIASLNDFGAIVSANDVFGYLKNTDFSDDYVKISDIYNVNDKLKVKLLYIGETGKVSFTVPEPYKRDKIALPEHLEVDQIVKGKVVGIKDWGFYTQIVPGADALCPLPQDYELLIGCTVAVKLTQIYDEKENVKMRGKLIRVLNYPD